MNQIITALLIIATALSTLSTLAAAIGYFWNYNENKEPKK